MKTRLILTLAAAVLLASVSSPVKVDAQSRQLRMFALTHVGHMYTRHSNDQGVSWSPFTLIHAYDRSGGSDWAFQGRPAAVSDAPGRYVMVAKASTGERLVYSYYTAGDPRPGWSKVPFPLIKDGFWQKLGFGIPLFDFLDAPALSSLRPGLIELFVNARRRTDGAICLLHTWTDGWDENGPIWSGNWEILGTGLMQGGPAAVSWGPDRTDVFVRGGGNELAHIWFENGRWSGWEHFEDGAITSSPAIISSGPYHLDIYAVGLDGRLYHKVFHYRWFPWEPLGDYVQVGTSPTVTTNGPGNIDAFAYHTDGRLFHRSWNYGWTRRDANAYLYEATVMSWYP